MRILVGSGVRISELCGIAVEAWDGLPDLMLDSIERLRAAMGHATCNMLQKYVRLATERDLGPRRDWAEFILDPEQLAR